MEINREELIKTATFIKDYDKDYDLVKCMKMCLEQLDNTLRRLKVKHRDEQIDSIFED